ncbi:ewing's tumor-associated antigen 1 isoform X1 [Seriola aureovittata]|uniref:ewing's tumor-associated antigen 1 isoform X1 n=1 Tax=Seriola aureovittata TaxID=2871759 RepID=UPI0024BEDD2E|nr:ewing's tumor-associated antigen 1 isoform X1 [Seriola aureovittata]
MNRGRGRLEPPAAETGSPPEQHRAPVRPNRLSRSFRPTQTAAEGRSPKSQRPKFKTPTRIPRSRAAAGFSGESPHNDSDLQHDIVWDAASPSPNRLGKRGRKHAAGAVNISELVSRIAPKHGRPEVTEPTLQQWIGDSAAIPCTPDVQVPKPKKKSPRPNAVDDLLKLAKQFDLNMFRQDEDEAEDEVEDAHQQSVELLSDDILDSEHNDFSPSLRGNVPPAVNAAAGTDVQTHRDQHMDEELDFLFDGPTQHVSGDLSQVSSAQPSQVTPALTSEASGKTPTTNTKGGGAASDEFEDDWENDDLLNDSLVLLMTQNPQNFRAPPLCSTQKPLQPSACGDARLGQSAASKAQKETGRQRATFKLESNPDFSVKRIQTDTRTNWTVDPSSKTAGKDSEQSRCSTSEGLSGETGSRGTWHTSNALRSDQKPQSYQRTCVSAASTSNASPTEAAPSHVPPPAAAADFLDEDLDAFFSSDPVWDDPADDDLLCDMCEDLENQIQSGDHVSTKQTPPTGQTSNQRAALQPSNRAWDNRSRQPANQKPFHQKQPTTLPGGSGRPAGRSLAVSAGVQVNTATDRTQGASGSGSCLWGGGRVQSAAAAPRPPQGKTGKDQFTFKRPDNPVSTVTSKALGKCSAAEIELKKQQAMERRRQRLQATQNLRAPT